MTLRERIEELFETQVAELAASGEFRALESGAATAAAYDGFLTDVVRTAPPGDGVRRLPVRAGPAHDEREPAPEPPRGAPPSRTPASAGRGGGTG